MLQSLYLTAVLSSFFSLSVFARPDGAPSCAVNEQRISMMGGKNQDLGYSVVPNATVYKPGTTLSFKINGAKPFKGILLYVSSSADHSKRVGNFVIPTGYKTNKPRCDFQGIDSGPTGVLTHSSPDIKQPGVEFTWTVERDLEECTNLEIHTVIACEKSTWQILPVVFLHCDKDTSPTKKPDYGGDTAPKSEYGGDTAPAAKSDYGSDTAPTAKPKKKCKKRHPIAPAKKKKCKKAHKAANHDQKKKKKKKHCKKRPHCKHCAQHASKKHKKCKKRVKPVVDVTPYNEQPPVNNITLNDSEIQKYSNDTNNSTGNTNYTASSLDTASDTGNDGNLTVQAHSLSTEDYR